MTTRNELRTCSECKQEHEIEVFLIPDEQFDKIVENYGPIADYEYICIGCVLDRVEEVE